MSYTALYRKYRPARFEDVLGQEHIVKTLKNQLVNGKVSHAYLFCGTRGTGKTTLAKIFAKALNCLSPEGGEPCGKCAMCAEIESERSLNVIEIDAASNNGVEHIREIRDEVRYSPAEGNRKVYIIDEVHMLSASAYNAFLKTLEEPPEHAIFILATTDPQKIPATVHSRCQRYDFKRIPLSLIVERLSECLSLEGVSADNDAIRYIAGLSDGSMRDALSLLDRCVSFFEGEKITLGNVLDITGSVDTACFYELTGCLNEMDSGGALAVVDKIAREGRDISQVIAEALSHFRNILIAKTVKEPAGILDIAEETAAELITQSQKVDVPRITSYISAFSELQANSRYAANKRVLLEIALIRLCNPEITGGGYEELYNKVLSLEKKIESGTVVRNMEDKPVKVRSKKENTQERAGQPDAKKVCIPGGLSEAKARYGEVIAKLSAERETQIFGNLLKMTELGFLDDKYLYVIFENEVSEDVLKKSPQKLELLKKVFSDITGKEYEIKTVTKESFEKLSKGIEIIEGADSSDGDSFIDSVREVFGEFANE